MNFFSCTGSEDPVLIEELETVVFDSLYHQVVLEKLLEPPNDYVMVMAHRGDWRNHPENSLSGIFSCIEKGVDIVEVDIQLTKDNQLILMHDKTLDRMTSGSGNVSDYNWSELQEFRLRNPDGSLSNESIPLLSDAMKLAKGRIVVFVDKGYQLLEEVHNVLSETNTLNQSIVEGIASLEKLSGDYPMIYSDFMFAPRIGTGQSRSYINSHLDNADNIFLFPSCNLLLSQSEESETVLSSDEWLLLATLDFTNCSEEFETTWPWAIGNGIDIIITDHPDRLLEYLRQEKKHL